MAYRPRRRGGIAKEVSSFATAFMQGMKLFSDDDRYGRSRARDPYSDENLAKRDERLAPTSALGRLFGKGENALTEWDRGRAVLDAKRAIAVERGDAPMIKKIDEDRLLLEKQSAIPSYSSREPVKPAEGAATTTRTSTRGAAGGDGSAATRTLGGDGSAASAAAARPTAGGGGDGSAAVVPGAAPARTVLAPMSATRTEGDGGGDGGGNGAPTFREAALNADEIPATEPAAYTWNPDQGSIFEREATFDSAPDFEMGVSVARGGMIPTMYAARGASVTDRMGSTGGALNMDEVTNPGARYTGGLEYGTAEGELEEGEEPGSPTMYRPEGPAIEDGEAAGRTANLNLPRDPEELAAVAAPALAAGVERIQAELKPTSAISAQDPAYQEKLQRFARGEGRMTDEEIAELDRVVDPDGNLAPSAKSAARLAAIYKFYEDRGEPDTARDVAARVILYDKFASQTRGAMALQALKDGDLDSGVKLLEDAYNQNMPDGKTLRVDKDDQGLVTVNEDGTINFNLGWDKLTGFQTTQAGRANRQDLIQLAQNTQMGTEQMQRLLQSVETGRGGSRAATGATGGARAQAAASAKEFETNRIAVEAATKGVVAARASDDPEALRAAEENLRAAIVKAQSGARSVNEQKQRDDMLRKTVNSVPGAVPTGRTSAGGGGTKEERAAAAEAARLDALSRREQALRADISASPIVEEEEQTRIRRGLQESALERANISAERAPQRTAFSKDAAKRIEPINEVLDTLLTEGKEEAKSGKVDTKLLPRMEDPDRRRFVDIADRMLGMNDQQPETVVRALYGMISPNPALTPQLISDGKGGAILAMGGERFIVDRDTYRRIAELRGENRSRARQEELAGFVSKQNREEAARPSAILPIDREQEATGVNMRAYREQQQKARQQGRMQGYMNMFSPALPSRGQRPPSR